MTAQATSIEANNAALGQARQRLNDWHFNRALPLWAGAGVHPSGGFYEALDFRGVALASDRARVRVQARQVAVFAAAHQAGWAPARSRALVEAGLDFMLRACRREDGVFGRVVDLRRQRLADPTADLYDTAFCLFAVALARPVVGASLDRVLAALLSCLARVLARGPGQGYCESLPPPAWRAQNPHMHLLEALLATRQASQGALAQDQLDDLIGFIATRFFDRPAAFVRERVGADGTALEPSYEPGHSFEWVWLLAQLPPAIQARLGQAMLADFSRNLYVRACQSLLPDGRTVMSADLGNKPVDGSTRLWSQTEALRAHLVTASLEPVTAQDAGFAAAALARAAGAAQGLLDDWLLAAPVAGGWLDHKDSAGRVIATNMPASTYYHLLGAIGATNLFCDRSITPRTGV